MTGRAVGYVRKSPDRKGRAGNGGDPLGPEVQREQLASYARREGLELVELYEDIGVSGDAPLEDRPGLLDALDRVGNLGITHLLVAKWDRLARSTLEGAVIIAEARKAGGDIVSVDGAGNGQSPEAELLRDMLLSFAAYQLKMIRIRTRRAMARAKERGQRVGSIPYGKKLGPDGKILVTCEREALGLKVIRSLLERGMSRRGIVAALNDSYPDLARGKCWHLKTVQKICKAIEAA